MKGTAALKKIDKRKLYYNLSHFLGGADKKDFLILEK